MFPPVFPRPYGRTALPPPAGGQGLHPSLHEVRGVLQATNSLSRAWRYKALMVDNGKLVLTPKGLALLERDRARQVRSADGATLFLFADQATVGIRTDGVLLAEATTLGHQLHPTIWTRSQRDTMRVGPLDSLLAAPWIEQMHNNPVSFDPYHAAQMDLLVPAWLLRHIPTTDIHPDNLTFWHTLGRCLMGAIFATVDDPSLRTLVLRIHPTTSIGGKFQHHPQPLFFDQDKPYTPPFPNGWDAKIQAFAYSVLRDPRSPIHPLHLMDQLPARFSKHTPLSSPPSGGWTHHHRLNAIALWRSVAGDPHRFFTTLAP